MNPAMHFLHRTLTLAAILIYLVALVLPAFPVSQENPMPGWECLVYGWQFNWMWLANPFLFGAWFAYARKSKISLYWAIGSLGTGVLFTSWAYQEMENFAPLQGHILWLTSITFTFAACTLALFSREATQVAPAS